jgi:integrase
MHNLHAALDAPTALNVTVAATRKRQVRRSARPREYLNEREIEKLMDAAGDNRWGPRDATAILLAYRHGLRASELVALRWDDIDFQTGKLHVQGRDAQRSPDWRARTPALRRLQREGSTWPLCVRFRPWRP